MYHTYVVHTRKSQDEIISTHPGTRVLFFSLVFTSWLVGTTVVDICSSTGNN